MAKTANPGPKPEDKTGAPITEKNAANTPAIENKLPEGEGAAGEKQDAGSKPEQKEDILMILIDDFDHKGFASFVATLEADDRAKVRANFQKALEILGEGPKVEGKAVVTADDAEDLDEDEDAKYLKRYGPGYMRAQHTDGTGRQTIFSAQGWKNLGEAKKDGSKEGWKVLVKTPPEVKNLQSKKS